MRAEVPRVDIVGRQFSMVTHVSVYLASRVTEYLLFQTIFSSMFERQTTSENRHTVSPEQREGLLGTLEDTNYVSLQSKGQAWLLPIIWDLGSLSPGFLFNKATQCVCMHSWGGPSGLPDGDRIKFLPLCTSPFFPPWGAATISEHMVMRHEKAKAYI